MSVPSLSFGNVAVGSTTGSETVTLTNTGTTNFKVSSVGLGGANASDFAIFSNTCTNATVVPNASCTVGVTFAPSASGSATATLTFKDNASNSPQTVSLSGSTTGSGTSPSSTSTSSRPGSAVASRLSGPNRIATAIAVSMSSFPKSGSAKAVVLARDDQFADALAGVPLAAAKSGPLLLTGSASLDPATKAEIQRVLPKGGTVYMLGGDAALAPSVATHLSGLGYVAVRLSGSTRFGTAVAIAGALGNPSHVFEVTGTNFPDAISAGPAAIAVKGAILLTNGSNQDITTFNYLHAHTSDFRETVGGPAASADPGAVAVVGANRSETAAALAAKSFPSPKVVGIATGLAFPDALSGGALIGSEGGPMLLVTPGLPVPASIAG
ncbi:MAG: cell wall-binding repeat-containing protein, partial [Acidimicrobiales bacterium]